MGRTKLARNFAPGRMRLQHDDRAASLHHCRHHGTEAHSTATQNQQGRTLLAGQGSHHAAGACLHAAAERTHQFDRYAIGQFHHIALISQCIIGKRGLTEEIARDRRAIFTQCAGAVRPHAGIVELRHGVAIGGLTHPATCAHAAGTERDADCITRFHLAHCITHAFDNA